MGGKITKLYPPPTKMKPKPNLSSERTYQSVHPATMLDLWSKNHDHLLRTAYKLNATKIEHSHWSTGHSTLM